MSDQTIEANVLTIVRVFDAPRELVFQCMIEPEHLTHFWGPIGVTTPIENITIDARPGGVFETVMVNDADGSRFPLRAEYVEVEAPARLVWVDHFTGITVTSTFVDLGDARTEVRIHQANIPEAFRTPEAQAGFESSLDRLASYLETL